MRMRVIKTYLIRLKLGLEYQHAYWRHVLKGISAYTNVICQRALSLLTALVFGRGFRSRYNAP